MPDGSDCWRQSHPDSQSHLCAAHWSAIIEDHRVKASFDGAVDEDHDSHRFKLCPVCDEPGYSSVGHPFRCDNEMCFTDRIIARSLTLAEIGAMYWDRMGIAMFLDHTPPTGWVYYLRFADRVKIGTTVNPKSRFKALPFDEILALERGSYELEAKRHREFARLRIPGQKEWFQMTPQVEAFTAHIRGQFGEPELLMRVHAA